MTLAALVLCALLQGGDGLREAARATARWVAPPTKVELGLPFELVLEVTHGRGDEPTIDAGELAHDPAWAVLDGGQALVLPDLDDPARRLSEVRWTVVVLEPGLRMLPQVAVRYGDEEIALAKSGLIDVAGVLAPDEDAPRPMPPDLGVGSGMVSVVTGWQIALGAGALLVFAAVVVVLALRALRRAPAAAVPAPSPLERLAALEEVPLDDPRAVREAHVELTRALRAQLDGATRRDALTDEEWLEALALPRDGELGRLLAECRPVEYGGELPTHWATRERVARARALAGQGAGS